MTESTMERTPPCDPVAEQAVVGSMMLSKNAIADVAEVLKGSDFYRPAHETIHDAILDLYGRGEPVDPIAVANRLKDRGDLERVGGSTYLHHLINAVPSSASAGYYAAIVHERAVLRRLGEASARITQMVYAAEGEANSIVDRAQAEIIGVLGEENPGQVTLVGDDLDGYLERLEALQRNGKSLGVPTGFTDLDALTGGLHPGQVVIVAGRPGMGKSTLALDFVRSCSITHNLPSVFFSLEMGRDELRHRIFSAQGRIALHHLRHQDGMTDEDWTRLAKLVPRVAAAPLHIDAEPSQTLARIRARCRLLQQTSGLRLVVIDYLQLLHSGGSRRQENRQQEVADMSRNLKLLAKELQVPVVVLSQLNRGPEQRTDKKPMVSDLRESGAIEQDADIVILLHREDAYDKESPRAGEADLIIGKHRNGAQPTITVAAQLHYSQFVDMAMT